MILPLPKNNLLLIYIKRIIYLFNPPTGSGKTLTAFLSILSELATLTKKGKLEDKVYCIYISPFKALDNDIEKNFEAPLSEIENSCKKWSYL